MELKQWHGFCLCPLGGACPPDAVPADAPFSPLVFLVRRDPLRSRGLFAVTVLDEVFEAETAGVLLPPAQGTTPAEPLREFVAANGACVLNTAFSAAFSVLERWHRKRTQPLRVTLVGLGDVGGTLLTALKLIGGDVISSIGICDLNQNIVARWTAEMGQISWPWDYDALPEVEPVEPAHLFECDVFLFAATKSIPAVGSAVQDVRMAQFAANRPLVESFARQAREAGFRGLFAVMSDPVDPLCKAAFLASNQDASGQWNGQGLLAEQIQGLGLGVMNARAAWFAKQDPRFADFLTEGRSFGPHGRGLVIANSVAHYDDALSRELTELVETANLRIRDLGFKPYVAPAISSGAMQLLLTLRGAWHCGSVCLGDVWFGVRNRYTPHGLETESLSLPDALFARLAETETLLREIL